MNRVVVVVHGGVVQEVYADSDTLYHVVDLDSGDFDEFEQNAALTQMESADESESFCSKRLRMDR